MKVKIKICTILFLLFVPFFNLSADDGGELFLSPTAGNYHVGQIFDVDIFVSSENRAVNAAEAVILFPSDHLEVVSISKQNSIFEFWAEEPVFANKSGIISFAGGLPSPGYAGKNGKILRIMFRAKTASVAEVKFKSGSVLANDGAGTNLLSFFGNSKYDLRMAISETKIAVSSPPASATTTEAVVEIKPIGEIREKCPECKICKPISFAKIFFLFIIIGFLINLAIFSIICRFKKCILRFYKEMRRKF